MRYCNKTKEIIKASYISCTAEEICTLLKDAGLRERSASNIKKHVGKLLEKDRIKEAKRKQFEKWAHKNPIKYRVNSLYYGARSRAKKKDIPFNLTKDWIEKKLSHGFCPVTGIEFNIKKYAKREEYTRVHPHAPSLDQIEPSAGYTKDNVQIVVDQYNKMKSDKSIQETLYLARRIVNHYDKKYSLRIKQT